MIGVILAKYWSQLLILGFCSALVLWYSSSVYQRGWDARDADWKADTAKREEYARVEAAKAAELAAELQRAYDQVGISQAVIDAQRSRKRDIEYREVVKTRTVYRETPNAGSCTLSADFVCNVDAAFAEDSGLPETSPDTCKQDSANGRISDIELLSYIHDAKRVCFLWRDEVVWWREWHQKLETAR